MAHRASRPLITRASKTQFIYRAAMPSSQYEFDSPFFRTALGRFATGVTIVTTEGSGGTPVGLTVSSFNSVSLTPPLVLWSLSNASSSFEAFQQCSHYTIHVLSADQIDLASRFARLPPAERFDAVPLGKAPGGALMLDLPVAAWFECKQNAIYPAGDHVIMVGEVIHCGFSKVPPLVFHAGGFDLTPLSDATKTVS